MPELPVDLTRTTPQPPTDTASLPLLMPVDQAAWALGLSPASVWRLCQQNRLRTVKLGRSTRVPRASVEALLRDLDAGHPLTIRTRTPEERRRAAERRAAARAADERGA